MGFELTKEQVQTIWTNNANKRKKQAKLDEYCNGDQDILDATSTRYDGQTRNLVVTNWIDYVVRKHTGFVIGTPATYSFRDGSPDEEIQKKSLIEIKDLFRKNDVPSLDIEHFRNSLIYGESVEVHWVEDGSIGITAYSPLEWAFLYNEFGDIVVAIHKSTLAIGTYYGGNILDKPVSLYTVYDDSRIIVYSSDSESDNVQGWVEVSNKAHHYKQLPVVYFSVSSHGEPFITDALISQQDTYNNIRSLNADGVEYNIDALLVLIGYEPDALLEKDTDGITYLEKLRQERILSLKEGSQAEFLLKGSEKDNVEFDLKLSRDAIHMMGSLADTEAILGLTGQTSGIALKMKLQPQIDQATIFTSYFEPALRKRIELVNIIRKTHKKSQLLDYDITFTLNIPVHEIEIWQNVGLLDHLLTRVDQLKLIPSIDDPEKAAEAKAKEEKAELESAAVLGLAVGGEDDVVEEEIEE